MLALAFVPLFLNWEAASRAGETETRDFAHDLLNSVEPYGILVTVGDNDTFPLWYAQEVEGIRRDVVVANTSLLNTDWYVRQIAKRPVYEYDAERGPEIYKGREWPKPTRPLVSWTEEEIDSLPLYQVLNQPAVFESPGTSLRTTLQPQVLERSDIFVLKMIQDSGDTRPVYFSRTAAEVVHKLNLQQFLLAQGFASRVLTSQPDPGLDVLPLPGQGWLDVRRSEALWREVFHGQDALIRSGGWVDRSSVGIPALYTDLGLMLTDAAWARGDMARAAETFDTTIAIARAVRLDDLADYAESVARSRRQPVVEPSDTMPRPVFPAGPAQSGTQ